MFWSNSKDSQLLWLTQEILKVFICVHFVLLDFIFISFLFHFVFGDPWKSFDDYGSIWQMTYPALPLHGKVWPNLEWINQRVTWFWTLKTLICPFQARPRFFNQGQRTVGLQIEPILSQAYSYFVYRDEETVSIKGTTSGLFLLKLSTSPPLINSSQGLSWN